MKPQIVFTRNEFRYCPEFPGPLRYDYEETEYQEELARALDKGIRFENQVRVRRFIWDSLTEIESFRWQPSEGDHWDCPDGVTIEWQSNYAGTWQRSTFAFDPDHVDTGLRKNDPMTRQVARLKPKDEDYLKIPSGTAIKRAKAKLLEKAGRPEDFPWPAKEEITEGKIQGALRFLLDYFDAPEFEDVNDSCTRTWTELANALVKYSKAGD